MPAARLGVLAICSVALLGSCVKPRTASEAPGRDAVTTQAALRRAVDDLVCADWSKEAEMMLVHFGDPACWRRGASPDKEHLAALAAVENTKALRLMAAESLRNAYSGAEKATERSAALDAEVRRVFWSDPLLGPLTLTRAMLEAKHAGLRCEDCRVDVAARRQISYAAFEPYLQAYFFPVSAAASGTGQIELFVCADINGVDRSKHTDSALLEAAYVSALAVALEPSTQRAIATKLAEVRTAHGTVDDLKHQVAQLLRAPAQQAEICASLESVHWRTGVVLAECPPPR